MHRRALQAARNERDVDQVGNAHDRGRDRDRDRQAEQRFRERQRRPNGRVERAHPCLAARERRLHEHVRRRDNLSDGDAEHGQRRDDRIVKAASHRPAGEAEADEQLAGRLDDLRDRRRHHIGAALIVAAEHREDRDHQHARRDRHDRKARILALDPCGERPCAEEQRQRAQRAHRHEDPGRHAHDAAHLVLPSPYGRLRHHFGQRRRQTDGRDDEHGGIDAVRRREHAERRAFFAADQILQRYLKKSADDLDDETCRHHDKGALQETLPL